MIVLLVKMTPIAEKNDAEVVTSNTGSGSVSDVAIKETIAKHPVISRSLPTSSAQLVALPANKSTVSCSHKVEDNLDCRESVDIML